jgi:hypothetical protein
VTLRGCEIANKGSLCLSRPWITHGNNSVWESVALLHCTFVTERLKIPERGLTSIASGFNVVNCKTFASTAREAFAVIEAHNLGPPQD